MSDQLFDYFGEMLRACLDTDLSSSPQIGADEFARFLTDDVRLHVLQGRLAATEWGLAEGRGPVHVAATHIVITEHGLLYAAVVTLPQPRHYLAAPRTLLDWVADHVAASPPPSGSAAAVDCRLDHDLASIWQFESALRHRLDTDPVLQVQLAPAFAA
ncbi:hypothetical protein HZU40_04395 [Mycolicibacterium fluoranthenivorans]|uniref:Glucose-6-phosphate dehydrogenase n=1 Tax=Mycolicibacterium fluoranthenivorans TaxID=258505 RepID=A0A7G8PGW6_9MYCO|nr:hypothetical protein [Mycolicibacterium fluoranthenivorans]QNJ93582.1 hypothetical protein HZU40_04395 [Mycolicibacterium fluoranthenivorans]